MNRLLKVFFILIAFLLLNSCAKNPVTGKNDFMLMSKGQEVAMGQQSDPDIVAFFGVVENPALQKFINEKGQEMVSISHRKDLKYEFKIVDSPVVNAFAVPGGYVYFTRGIMAHFNNEAEFAGVLGHEIGHITARHSAKQYSNAQLAQIGLAAGSILSPTFAQLADMAQSGVQLLFLKFGRDAESQADKLGAEYSTKIGYDAQQMSEFFKTLDRLSQQSEKVPTFLSTHPDPADREVKVAKEAANWKKKVDIKNLKVNRDVYLRMIDGLVYGEDPKQGFVENNVFYHPVLKFQFPVPAQWAVQNTPQQVQMGSKDGKALMMFTLTKGNSLEEAGNTLLQQYQLKLIESKKESVNGLSALALIADQVTQTQQQQQQVSARTLVYIINYDGNMYVMLGASSPQDFNAYFQLFQSTMSGFKALTDPDKLNKQPEHIRVKTVPQTETVAQVFKTFNVKENRMEELSIINGMKLTDKVERGSLIKILE
jgi:predicted Zn-dependent protease